MSAEVGRVFQHICAGSFCTGQPVLGPASESTPSSQRERQHHKSQQHTCPTTFKLKRREHKRGLWTLPFSSGQDSEAQSLWELGTGKLGTWGWRNVTETSHPSTLWWKSKLHTQAGFWGVCKYDLWGLNSQSCLPPYSRALLSSYTGSFPLSRGYTILCFQCSISLTWTVLQAQRRISCLFFRTPSLLSLIPSGWLFMTSLTLCPWIGILIL